MTVFIVGATLAFLIMKSWPLGGFSPDSRAYWELSKHIFDDFYRINTIRTFATDTKYGTSFPPLWPTLIAVAHGLTGLGPAIAVVIACVSFGAFAGVAEALVRRVAEVRWVGAGGAMMLLAFQGFTEELAAGRSLPLQMLLYALAAQSFYHLKTSKARSIPLGVWLGLAVLNRFDALPVSVVMICGVLPYSGRLRSALAAAIAFIAVISPWMVYSAIHHGTLFATDNGGVALSAFPSFVTDYYRAAPLSALEAPLLWARKITTNSVSVLASMYQAICMQVATVGLIGGWYAIRREPSPLAPAQQRNATFLLVLATASLAQLSAFVATGYEDSRYFSPQLCLISIAILAAMTRMGGHRAAAAGALTVSIVGAVVTNGYAAGLSQRSPLSSKEIERISDCVDSKSRERVLFLDSDLEAAQFGALTGIQASYLPRNANKFTVEDWQSFLTRFNISHIYTRRTLISEIPVNAGRVEGCASSVFEIED